MKLFNQTFAKRPKRNAFDLGHERKFSMNMGDLTPILCEEVLPGDTFKLNTEVLMRLAPMVSPVMHRVNVYTHFFFVPNRLIWKEWEDFITGGEDGTEEPVRPYIQLTAAQVPQFMGKGSLADHLGFPTTDTTPTSGDAYKLNSLPFNAYQAIYNDYYRDQNLEEKVAFDKNSGQTSTISLQMAKRKRAWEKDYFTSALPWTQRGGEVNIPMSGNAEVKLVSDVIGSENYQILKNADTGVPINDSSLKAGTSSGLLMDASNNEALLDPAGTLEADLSSVNATTIEELRRATKLQSWLERAARGGSRYIEQIKSHFGITSSDARLQRPEFLGGGKNPIVISEVLQTSSTDTETPQGNMAGHGIGVGNSNSFKKSFEEHGYIIGIMSVLPKTTYHTGIRKHLLKQDKFDYYWPEFAQLGEQPVLNEEIYASFDTAVDPVTWGYQSRYAEYKYIPSSVHGEMKDTLKYWHMGRDFSSLPPLNNDFVKADPTHRIFAVDTPTEDKLFVQVYHNLKAIRPIPAFNNPSLI